MYHKLSNLKHKNREEFFRLFAGIPENVDVLDLRYNDLAHRPSAELVQAFKAMPIGVTSLDLRDNGLEYKTGAQLVEMFQSMPTDIQSVHLYDENNDFVNFRNISAIQEKINQQIANLATSRFWVSIGVIEASDAKIKALEDLKALFLNSPGKKQEVFHDELRQWKKNNWECIARQRNVLHRFFSPDHKSASAITVDDIFARLGIADKPENGVPIIAGLKNPLIDPYKPGKPVTAKKIAEVERLINKINGMVFEEIEARNTLKKEDGLANVSETYINRLIANMKDIKYSKTDIWDKLDQMSYKDIKLLVSKLRSDKQKGKHGSSELDYLWRQFQGLEFEPSLMQGKRNKFAEIVEVLSEEQLKASFDSPDFLKILNQDVYAEALANTLNYNQMALFSSETKRHDILNKMIKKLKPAPDLFSKLVAIMPYSSGVLRENLENQITHLPHDASFKLQVVELVRYYIDANYQAYKSTTKPVDRKPDSKEEIPSPKWKKITIATKPVYNDQPVKKTIWTEQSFARFVHDLNDPMYITNKNTIIEDLNSMPDERIKMLVGQASEDLLQHLWVVESTTTNHNSYTEARERRLKIILENVSDAQLGNAATDNRFWEIFGNTQQPFCKMAAAVLTPKQFKTLISNAELCKHSDLARIILFINKDTPQDKTRLNEIIEAILPYTTPWLVLTLQLKIKDLSGKDKAHLQHLNEELKRYLNESMKRDDVILQYIKDTRLDKKAVSNLFVKDVVSKTNEPLDEGESQTLSM